MKQSWMTYFCGVQSGILATFIALFFIPGPAPPEGGCKCSTQATDQGASVVLDNREICGLTEEVSLAEVSTETEPVKDAYRPSVGEYMLAALLVTSVVSQERPSYQPSLGDSIFTAARRCRPCGTNCRCGAICRCPK